MLSNTQALVRSVPTQANFEFKRETYLTNNILVFRSVLSLPTEGHTPCRFSTGNSIHRASISLLINRRAARYPPILVLAEASSQTSASSVERISTRNEAEGPEPLTRLAVATDGDVAAHAVKGVQLLAHSSPA